MRRDEQRDEPLLPIPTTERGGVTVWETTRVAEVDLSNCLSLRRAGGRISEHAAWCV